MTGLQAILEQISADSRRESEELLRQAVDQGEQITAHAAKEADLAAQEITHAGKLQADGLLERAVSAAQLEKRNRLLLVKQNLIHDTIDSVRTQLENAPDEEYFGTLLKLVARYAIPGEGVLYCNAKDLARLPADFQDRLSAACPEGKLTISKEPKEIESGFLLVYGGVDINCTFRAVFEDAEDALRDCVYKALFPDA